MNIAITLASGQVYRCYKENQEEIKEKIARMGFTIKHIKFQEDKAVDYSKKPTGKFSGKVWYCYVSEYMKQIS